MSSDMWSKILDAVQNRQWAVVAALAIVAVVAGLRWLAPKLHDKFGAFLNSQRGGAMLALVGGMSGAIAAALLAGQKLSRPLLMAGFGTGLMAIGGWNAFWDLVFPSDTPKGKARKAAKDAAKALLPFFFALSATTLMGCALLTKVVKDTQCLGPAILDVISGSAQNGIKAATTGDADWDAFIKDIEVKHGKEAALCLASAIEKNMVAKPQAGPAHSDGLKRVRKYTSAGGVK